MNSSSIGIFNLMLGISCILIGTGIYWPFNEKSSEKMKKFKPFYLYSGIGLLIWGIVNLLS